MAHSTDESTRPASQPQLRPPIPRGRPETGSPYSNRPPRPCKKPNPSLKGRQSNHVAAASYDPSQATPAENVFQATKRFKRFETFWNVFQAQANFLPGRRPSIHSYRATGRKDVRFLPKNPPYLRQRSQEMEKILRLEVARP